MNESFIQRMNNSGLNNLGVRQITRDSIKLEERETVQDQFTMKMGAIGSPAVGGDHGEDDGMGMEQMQFE